MKRRWLQIVVLGLLAAGVFLFQARRAACLTVSAGSSSGLAGTAHVSKLLLFAAQEGEGKSQHSGRKAFFEWLNFAILVGGLFYLLRKPLASYFSTRSVNILKGLEEGRKALEESGAKLKSVEQRLQRLNEDITALQAEAAKDMEAEAERMRRQAIVEAERASESARAQIEAATRAAKIELKAFAANQATEIAGQMVRGRLDRENQGKLVQRFFEGLNGKS
ncbi:MAG TPA: ATP synthase F0 subunit B [Terriglobia bacterium]|nr:ATP synthase F0 subunit B [Terriglobia bacterium]